MQCVHCKRPVGTIFSMENRTLGAKCGDVNAPCPLNIQIYKGRVTRLDDDFKYWYNEYIKDLTETIVKTKLDVLFQYISEEDAVKLFQETKEQLDMYKMGYNTDYSLYLEKNASLLANQSIATYQDHRMALAFAPIPSLGGTRIWPNPKTPPHPRALPN